MSRWRPDVVFPAAAAASVAALATGVARTQVPAFLPTTSVYRYDAATPAAVVALEPVAHAPWLGDPGTVVVAATAAAVAVGCWTASRRLGASFAASLVAVAGFVVRPDARDLLAMGAPALASIAGVWGALVIAPPAGGGWRATLWSGVLLGGALAIWPPAVLVAPLVAMSREGFGRAAALLMAIALGALFGVWRWTVLAATTGGTAVTLADAWAVIAGLEPRSSTPFVWPPVSAAWAPVVLMAVGVVAIGRRAPPSAARWPAIAVCLGAAVTAPLAWRDELVRAWYWTAWPATALGVDQLARVLPGRGRTVATALLAAVLVGGGLVAERATAGTASRAFAAALQAIAPDRRDGIVVVAEEPRVDTALVAARGAGLARLRPVPNLVEARRSDGARVWAGPGGRRLLEAWGVRFMTRAALERPSPFSFSEATGRFRCVPVAGAWRELPGLEYTGRLGVHLPAGRGRFEMVVIGAPPSRPAMTALPGQSVGRSVALAMDRRALPAVLWPDGGQAPDPSQRATHLAADADEHRASTVLVALGSRAPLVAVRFADDARSVDVARVCAAPLPVDDLLDAASTWTLALDQDAPFAAGWHAPQGRSGERFRWTAGAAVLLVPSSRSRAVTLALDAAPAATGAPAPTVTATINGWPAGTHAMRGASTYTWSIPETLWVDGTNEIRLGISRTRRPSDAGGADTRELGARVSGIRLTAR